MRRLLLLPILLIPLAAHAQYDGYQVVSYYHPYLGGNDPVTAVAACPAGKVALTGGFRTDVVLDLAVASSYPFLDTLGTSGWHVEVLIKQAAPSPQAYVHAYAVCVNAQQTGQAPAPPAPPVSTVTFVLRSVLDDHTQRNASDYQVRITLNGTEIFMGNPGVDHGSPAGGQFTNFGDLSVSVDETFLLDGQNILRVTLSGVPSGDWFAWDYATIGGIHIESETRWAAYSSTGVDGVYGGNTREWRFNWSPP